MSKWWTRICAGWIFVGAMGSPGSPATAGEAAERGEPPNVVVILTDDMGFSDLGCYGGEIRTPNLDRLAREGLRFTEFYNAARCCPTRASLLTGQYQQRVGMYRNGRDITRDGVTVAEVLKQHGYQTAMTGKWHLTALAALGGGNNSPEHLAWINNQRQPERAWGNADTYPTARGFERFYGTIFGIVNFFDPWTLMEGNQPVLEVPADYYLTDATSDRSAEYIREMSQSDSPFFLYVAYHAPHWPLHALPEDVARYKGRYDAGWDAIRRARYERQVEMGLFDEATTPLPPIQGAGGSWDSLPPQEQRNLAKLMEVHAAMVDNVDQGIGRIVEALKQAGRLENTLLIFLADNGASPERHLSPGYDRPSQTRDGRPIVYRRFYDEPGSETTWPYIGPRWSSAANTPFRYWKAESYKGGMQTPLIVHWPAGLATEPGGFTRQRGHVIDLMPTILEAAGAEYPSSYAGRDMTPMDGKSLMPIFRGEQRPGHAALFFEHDGHKSVIRGPWKANQLRRDQAWQLYHIEQDRTETTDVGGEHPGVLQSLVQQWRRWADDVDLPHGLRR